MLPFQFVTIVVSKLSRISEYIDECQHTKNDKIVSYEIKP